MWFCFTHCVIVVILAFLSVLWRRRLRGLCKLPDGRDWWWKHLGLALVGSALLSKALIQLSADGWGWVLDRCLAWGDPALGSMVVGLMATSKRVYTKGDLPRQLLPVPPSLWWAPADHASTRDPPTLAGSFGSVSCGVTAPFFWVLVRAGFVCAVQDWNLFPLVLWSLVIKSCWPS